MPQVAILGQITSHGAPIMSTPNTFITIDGILVDTVGSMSMPHHGYNHPLDTRSDVFLTSLRSYVTINGQPILTLGSIGSVCPSIIIPIDAEKGQSLQNFVFIN